ncbi:Leucine-rich repeat-containing protein 14, partial [Lemmus lemmus]
SKCFSLFAGLLRWTTRNQTHSWDLAIHQLLSNESAAIHALEEIPRELFIPLFSAAFKGVHKTIVKAMVKVWPFTCLHIGTFTVREPLRELLTAMLECLQFLPVQNSGLVLPTSLDFLHLTFCKLSYNDFKFLAECPQANHLKLLNISHNAMYWEDCEPFYNLLNRISGTLQHLAFNQSVLTDSIVSGVIPALSRCSQLQELNFNSNPVSMPMLIRLLEHLTPLMELKYVIYPIPVHCFGRWQIQDS